MTDEIRTVAEDLLTAIGTGASADAIAEMFHHDVIFEVPGDDDALPWIGRKVGLSAVRQFIDESRRLLKPRQFEVRDIVTNGSKAVILGALASVVSATDHLIETQFAIVLTVSDRRISHFLMFEDSFRVSVATRA
ncbi:nuclear transport factor 2 family protein [Sphingomonas sp. RB3P16]|uniref:nuclear transport factor 2 family protein n=1 Tax=Parasphingomonas frigoris TaxID=3096163 RepID=UPI002FCC79BF